MFKRKIYNILLSLKKETNGKKHYLLSAQDVSSNQLLQKNSVKTNKKSI